MKRSAPTRRTAPWRRAAAWLASGWIALGPVALQAAPEGERVRKGSADFQRDGDTTTITTHSDRTVIDYKSFDIDVHETVQIDQPTSSSSTLNRVFSSDPTRIDGWLVSNGGVWIANPSGVFFGGESVVDVGSLVAGAGTAAQRDFMQGELRFTRLDGELQVASGARIEALDAVLLAGGKVANFGHVSAPGGMIALVAGDSLRLLQPGGGVRVVADARDARGPRPEAALVQGGTLDAGDGHVSLVAGDAYSLAMNRDGVVRAGEIHVEGGDDSRVAISGVLDAASRGGDGRGGAIRVLGEDVSLGDALLDASGAAGGGEILVGGDYQGGGDTRTAWRTQVAEDAALRADALEAGDGGRIIVWADGATVFRGALSARGGAEGGDGGFAEISGKQALVSRGDIDLSAPAGAVGTVLYDPLHIRIVGGSGDGTDRDDDPLLLRGDGGKRGRIRLRDQGDGDGIAPFVISEDEIEKTDANIILLAGRSIRTEGSFAGDEVVIQPGRNLELEVRDDGGDLASPDFVGIDIRSSDGGDLTWTVSDGGSISLLANGDAGREVGADILVGTLVARNAPGAETLSTVSIETSGRGDVEVGAIDAGGGDGVGVSGGNGGAVAISARQGTVTVGSIDVSGGEGRLTNAEQGGGIRGGAAGSISITADPFVPEGGGGAAPPTILVTGDLLARGGEGLGSESDDEGERLGAAGGTGGRVLLSAGLTTQEEGEGSVEVQGAIDASGGDGTARGGNTSLGAISPQTGALTGAVRVEAHSDVAVGDLIARGGDAGVKQAAEETAGGFGGSGGAVTLSSASGAVTLAGTADVGGGAGFAEEVIVEDDGDVRFAGQGGAAGSFGADAAGDGSGVALLGAVLARGGDGALGSGGAGGTVTVSAADGPISLAAIDVGGGAGTGFADESDGAREATGALGGNGGNVTATTRSVAGGASVGGDLTLTGDIRSLGGAGVDPDAGPGDEDPRENHGVGGLVRLDASQALVGAGAPTVRAGTVEAVATTDISGLALAASGDASPESFDDAASVRAGGTATVVLDEDADGADTRFDFAEAVARGAGATLDVTSDDGSTRLAGSGAGALHTVTALVSDDDDPFLSYRLVGPPDETVDQVDVRTLAVADGAVDLGARGGAVVNARVDAAQLGGERLLGAVRGATPGAGLDTRGTLDLVGIRVQDLSVDGSGADARLQLRVGGDVSGVSGGAGLASVGLEQRAADSDVSIALPGGDGVEIEGAVFDDGASRIESSRVTRVDTTASGIGFFYDLSDATASSNDPGRGEPVLSLDGPVTLGGDGGFSAAGDLVLGTTVDASAGAGAVALIADANADGRGGLTPNGGGVLDVDRASALLVGSGESVGSEAEPLRVRGGGPVLALAGLAAGGDFRLVNESGDLVLTETEIAGLEVALDLGDGASALRAGGEVDLDNGGRSIAFGPTEDGDLRPHVASGGGQRYGGDVLLANPSEVETVDPDTGDPVTEARNDVVLQAGGDVVFEGGVDTAQAQLDAGLPGTLDVRSGGTTTFGGDVGRDVAGTATVAKLAVDDARFEGDRAVTVASADFRGRLDGTGDLVLRALGEGSQIDFGGDVGGRSAPTRFDADADLLRFEGADRISAGEVSLNAATPAASVPDLATIADTGGGLRIRSAGDVRVGAREKLSVAGPLQIQAGGEAHLSDLSATEIRVAADRIVVQGREPGLVQLADGRQSRLDDGVDWVANTIRTNATPEWDGVGTQPTLVLGAGGLSIPGGPPFETIRFDDEFSAVEPESFEGVNGTLDLSGTGPRVVADPGSDLPRGAGPTVGGLVPRSSDTQPVLADPPGARQVLAFVRCRTREGDPCDPVQVASVPRDSALETERAREVVQRYHDLVASERGRMALRAAFAPLAAAPAEPDALLGALRRDPELLVARERLRELATVLTEVSLLGLEQADLALVRRALAADFAASTGVAAFDAELALAAAEQTGVGRVR